MRTGPEVCEYRENVISRIEKMGDKLWNDWSCAVWDEESDEKIQNVAFNVKGPLFELLLDESGHEDKTCAELFRKGGCGMHLRGAYVT